MPIVERVAFHRASETWQTRGRGCRRIGRSLPETRLVERSEHFVRTASFRLYFFRRKKKVPPEDAQLDSERFQKVFDFRVDFRRARFRERPSLPSRAQVPAICPEAVRVAKPAGFRDSSGRCPGRRDCDEATICRLRRAPTGRNPRARVCKPQPRVVPIPRLRRARGCPRGGGPF